jgi:probable rRNA maturation factor
MTFEVDIQNQNVDEYALDAARLELASSAVLTAHDVQPGTGVSVVIASDDFVRDLNLQYRRIDAPTDILSFPADEPPVELENEPPYLGDLVIAYPYAAAQAMRLGHKLEDSLGLLVVHGTLHLLGYEHDTPANRAEMWAAQETALKTLGIPLNIVPSLEESSHDDPA